MSVISELIRSESNGTISFGDYSLAAKAKVDNFEHAGDLYKVKTYQAITKLERNGMFVYESVPGTAVTGFKATEEAQITLELEAGTEYDIQINGTDAGVMKTNLGGKLSISVEFDGNSIVTVGISKK